MSLTKLSERPAASTPHRVLQPQGWVKPVGYANGVEARGRTVFVGGQIGWNGQCRFEAHDLPGQVRQTLQNIVDILAEGRGRPRARDDADLVRARPQGLCGRR